MIVNTELAKSTGHIQKDLWETPDWLYEKLDKEHRFTLDPCCTTETAKCKKFYTPLEDGLKESWAGERVFVNPPYSRGNIDLWAEKVYREAMDAERIVTLLPVSTSSQWFHKYVWKKCLRLNFLEGRIQFKGAPFVAPFSSMIAIY